MPIADTRWIRRTTIAARGFGLIELVITIAVLAVLTTIALPSFNSTIRSNRVSTQANDLLSAIQLARSEAVARSRGVSVCAADTGAGVPAACGSDWGQGWIAFVDDLAMTAPATAPTNVDADNILKVWTADSQATFTADTDYIRFSPHGQSMQNGAGVTGDATLAIVPGSGCSGDQQRIIEVNAMGRAKSRRDSCP
ncbi:MAG TPA: GspH/FimT family pseudopilin [Rhodanobacteraceae bacterium]|nr:GspH/FimT family pseudopilin [Rhodanobacteraceae bacterium]